jgi:hypothetical protein
MEFCDTCSVPCFHFLPFKVSVVPSDFYTITDAAAVYEKLGTGWATSLLGFISVAMLPIPWILFKWGPQIRAKSHYPTMIQ